MGLPNPKTQILYDTIQSLKTEKDKLHTQAIKQTKELTSEHIPRLATESIRHQVKIPVGKKPGDEISFDNPHIPNQRLKVNIPLSAKGATKFVAIVPKPGTPSTRDENKFPKEYRDLLDDYTRSYDGWVDAEIRYRTDMNCVGSFKPGNGKMKKFDAILKLFPNNSLLRTPIDGPYLRKVVRKVRQNSSKRRQFNIAKKKLLEDTINETSINNESITTTTTTENPTTTNPTITAKPTTATDDIINASDLDSSKNNNTSTAAAL